MQKRHLTVLHNSGDNALVNPQLLPDFFLPVRRKVFGEKRQLAFFAKDVADRTSICLGSRTTISGIPR